MHSRLLSVLFAALGLLALLAGGLLSVVPGGQAYAQSDEPTPRPLYALPDARANPVYTSSTLARSDSLGLIVAANSITDVVSVVNAGARELLAQIPVADDPRTVAITADGLRALVTNRGAGTLTVLDLQTSEIVAEIPLGGVWPYGVVTGNNRTAYVSLQGSDEVVVVDLVAEEVVERISTPATPTGLALWGDFLYVTHLWSGDLSLVYMPQARTVRSIRTGVDVSLSPSLDIDLTRGLAYMPQSRANAADPVLTYDTVVFPTVNVVALDGLDLRPLARITPNTAARPVNSPFAVELDPFRQWAYIANAGSNDLTVVDTSTGLLIAHLDVGANPRGLLLSGDNSLLYVHNMIDGTLSIVETDDQEVIDTLPINPDISIPVDVLIGAELFHTAVDDRMSQSGWVSCANCHMDGMTDGRTWADFPEGARNTPLLFDLRDTAPYNWSGTWDELADVELKIRGLQAGDGLLEGAPNDPLGDPHAGLSLDLDTLVIYMDTLQGSPSPLPAEGEQVERGAALYEELGCPACHTLPTGTNGRAYDVGTGGRFDTPTVNWLWASAPYLHDGSAPTLRDLFAMPGAHRLALEIPQEDIDALIAYLLSLPAEPSSVE